MSLLLGCLVLFGLPVISVLGGAVVLRLFSHPDNR